MTYPDDPNLNDPRRPDILRKRDDSAGVATIAAIAAAIVVILGIAIYATSGSRDSGSDAPRVERTTPSTTGQGGTNTIPGRDQNIPNPAPPLPPVTKQPQ